MCVLEWRLRSISLTCAALYVWGSHHAKFVEDNFNSFRGITPRTDTHTHTHTHTRSRLWYLFQRNKRTPRKMPEAMKTKKRGGRRGEGEEWQSEVIRTWININHCLHETCFCPHRHLLFHCLACRKCVFCVCVLLVCFLSCFVQTHFLVFSWSREMESFNFTVLSFLKNKLDFCFCVYFGGYTFFVVERCCRFFLKKKKEEAQNVEYKISFVDFVFFSPLFGEISPHCNSYQLTFL